MLVTKSRKRKQRRSSRTSEKLTQSFLMPRKEKGMTKESTLKT